MTDLYAEALHKFADLYAQVQASAEPEPTAVMLATSTAEGRPSVRTVLLKAWDARGFVFYTHLDSRKGQELRSNPHAALLFLWKRLNHGVQVRIEGGIEIVSDAEADAYFATRPRMSQLGAWASLQSETLDSRDTFEQRIAKFETEFAGRDVSRPSEWSGFRVIPEAIEFWHGAEFRLHERWLYERNSDGAWTKRMLYP